MLEHLRLELWLDCLERGNAGSERWQELLSSRLPGELQQRAQVGLGRALIREWHATHPSPGATGAGALSPLEEITGQLVASESPAA
jgi:hypothetical protein